MSKMNKKHNSSGVQEEKASPSIEYNFEKEDNSFLPLQGFPVWFSVL